MYFGGTLPPCQLGQTRLNPPQGYGYYKGWNIPTLTLTPYTLTHYPYGYTLPVTILRPVQWLVVLLKR